MLTSTKSRALALSLFVGGALSAFFFREPHAHDKELAASERQHTSSEHRMSRANFGADSARERPRIEPQPGDVVVRESAMVDTIAFEPQVPCVGDVVVVRTALIAEAEGSKVFVNGRPGEAVVVPVTAELEHIRVVARDWHDQMQVIREPIRTRTCADNEMRLIATAERVGQHHYVFSLSGDAANIEWEFGDGEASSEAQPHHRYVSRADRPISSYLAYANYDGPSGRVRAPVNVTHAEPLAIASATPFPYLENEGEPYVPFSSGLARIRRQVTNHLDQDLELEAGRLLARPCDGSEAILMDVAPAEVLSQTTLPAGESVELELRVLEGEFGGAEICSVQSEFAAITGDGLATLDFHADTRIAPPGEAVTSEALVELVAQHYPDRDYVSAEEIALLQAQTR